MTDTKCKNILYLDPWSGISGDMMLGALLDAGGEAIERKLHEAVTSLGLKDVALEIVHDTEWGIRCTRVNVHGEESPPLRHLEEMMRVVHGAALSERVKTQAQMAVRRLAEVEAGIHGCPVEDIHFHEVGAADTLVDIVGSFVLVEALGVDQVIVGTIPVGGGTVEIAHGRMGVPAPATLALLSGYQISGGPESRELTTPTGALLVGQLQAVQGPLPAVTVSAVGYGAGSMKLQSGPNVLRAVVGSVPERTISACVGGMNGLAAGGEPVVELQTNVDDVSGEVIGYTLRRLREAGVLDTWTVAAQMKKDRPGVVIHVLANPEQEEEVVRILFTETGTLGIRRVSLGRHVARRGRLKVSVEGHDVAVKWGSWGDRVISLAPEYEDAAAAASALATSLQDVMGRAIECARRLLEEENRV